VCELENANQTEYPEGSDGPGAAAFLVGKHSIEQGDVNGTDKDDNAIKPVEFVSHIVPEALTDQF
jgi:hypothetical protein